MISTHKFININPLNYSLLEKCLVLTEHNDGHSSSIVKGTVSETNVVVAVVVGTGKCKAVYINCSAEDQDCQ